MTGIMVLSFFQNMITDPDPVALTSVGAIGAWYSAKERTMSKKGYTVFKDGFFWHGGDSWSTRSTDAHVGSYGQASVVARNHGGDVIAIEVLVGDVPEVSQ